MRPKTAFPHTARQHSRGVTLVELMVTVTVLVIIVSLAIPNWQTFVVRNQVSTLSTDFARDFSRARSEAISNNQCVTICQSVTTTDASPTCVAADDDWNRGWIAFVNTTCTAGQQPDATNRLLFSRNGGPATLTLKSTSTALYRVMFTAKGMTTLGVGGGNAFNLVYEPESGVSQHDRRVCLSSAGRTLIKKAGATCP